MVIEECGWKPGVGLPDEVVVFLAASLKIFAADAGEREARGQSAQHRCLDQFAWSQRKKNLTEFIREVV
jgi:hypothetical protein